MSSVSFQCPSCFRNLRYSNGETPFQTCYHCKGKIIVPSLTVHQVEIESTKPTEYALQTQKDLKLAEIRNELNAGRKIEAIRVFRETFGADLKTAKEAVERLAVNKKVEISRADLRDNYSALQESISPTTSQAPLQKQQPAIIVRLINALIYLAIFIAIYYWLTN